MEKQISSLNTKLQLKESENLTLKKENDQLKNDLKNISNDLGVCENRLKRTTQEVEKNKAAIKILKQEDKVRTALVNEGICFYQASKLYHKIFQTIKHKKHS